MGCGDTRGFRGDVQLLICNRRHETMIGQCWGWRGGAIRPMPEGCNGAVDDAAICKGAESFGGSEHVPGEDTEWRVDTRGTAGTPKGEILVL